MNLNLITSLDPIGYGYVGRSLLKELFSAGVEVALFPLSYNVSASDDPNHPVNRGMVNAGRYDPGAKCPDRTGPDTGGTCRPRQACGFSDF